MADRQRTRPVSSGLLVCALLTGSVAGLYGTGAVALPFARQAVTPAAGVILIQEPAAPAAGAGQERAPFAELNEALAAARARLEELSKAATVAAVAGQARQELEAVKQENQRLTAELATLRASRDELQMSSQGAEARIAELSKAAEDAAVEAKRIEEELVGMRWQNAQLNTSLARAQAAREQVETEARKAQEVLSTKVETLSTSAERSASEIARLQAELAGSEQRLEIASTSRSDAEARFAELQAAAESAAARSTRLDEQLSALRSQLAQAAGERDQARQRVTELGAEAGRLRSALASAEIEVEQGARGQRDLEQEVAQLRAAAGSAADAARQNLRAVEDQIKELNAALAGVEPAAGDGEGEREAQTPAGGDASGPSLASTAAAAVVVAPIAEAAPRPTEVAATATRADGDLDVIEAAHLDRPSLDQTLARATVNLPLEMRLQVQGLLVDLGAKAAPRGLALIVPGEGLFAMNSDRIEPTAHDTLAKVAELINAYDDQKVMIVGYTDAIGEASYNKTLSQRRANLVRQFFVENFEIDGARLSTEGRGEDQPIASNDTLTGRQANRRVEVLILD